MPASVRSTEAIRRVRDALARFGAQAAEGLTEIDAEARKVLDWVEHDRPGYWKRRVARAYDDVAEAKNALHRCLMYPINDEQPSCVEEREALKGAEARLAECREKQERVRHWAAELRHESHEYHGRTAALREAIDLDNRRAAASLGRMLDTLERYATGRASEGPIAEEPAAGETVAPDEAAEAAATPPADVSAPEGQA